MLTVILGRFYSQEEVGYFNQANKWTSMGYSTILGTINGIAQPVLRNVSEDTERNAACFARCSALQLLYHSPLCSVFHSSLPNSSQ